jgi:nucleoside-triphosphatase THEP1
MELITPILWLLTGPSGAGKTTFCRHLAQAADSQTWDVAGLLSPAWMEMDQKIGILAEELRSGEQRTLAYTQPFPKASLQFGPWYFDSQVFDWGNQVISKNSPCDLLIVDELGPLEFNRQLGFTAAFDAISRPCYRVSCVVVRPSLLDAALRRWPWARPLDVSEASIPKILSI